MAGLAFKYDMDFSYGRARQVSPLIRRIICNNPGPFTFTGTGTYIIGTQNLAVIDPGPVDEEHYAALIAELDGKTVSHIIVTHTHMDHSPLAARLKAETGAKIYAYGPHDISRAQQMQINDADVRLDEYCDIEFAEDVTVRHGDVIEGGGWTLEAVFTPGHTSNHTAFALREEKALFSGDHIMAWSTSVIAPPDGNMSDYLNSLKILLDRAEEIYWPTHGPPKTSPRDFVRGFISHRKMREEAIFRRIRRGDRTIGEIVKSVYSKIDPKLHPAAAMSTFAHIEHLLEQEKIVTDNIASLDSEYRIP